MNVTPDLLRQLLPTLDKPQFSVLLRSVLGLRTAQQLSDIPTVDQLKAGLWEFMTIVGFVTDAQARKVLERVEPALRDVAPVYESGIKTLPAFHVTFAEQRWVAHPTAANWYDMVYDEEAAVLPEPPVLLVTCDVTAMYLRQQQVLKRLEGKDAGPGHHAGNHPPDRTEPDPRGGGGTDEP